MTSRPGFRPELLRQRRRVRRQPIVHAAQDARQSLGGQMRFFPGRDLLPQRRCTLRSRG